MIKVCSSMWFIIPTTIFFRNWSKSKPLKKSLVCRNCVWNIEFFMGLPHNLTHAQKWNSQAKFGRKGDCQERLCNFAVAMRGLSYWYFQAHTRLFPCFLLVIYLRGSSVWGTQFMWKCTLATGSVAASTCHVLRSNHHPAPPKVAIPISRKRTEMQNGSYIKFY